MPADAPQQSLDVPPRHRLVAKPGGLQGFLGIGKTAQGKGHTVADRPDVPVAHLELSVGAPGPEATLDHGHDLIAAVHDPLDLDDPRLKCLSRQGRGLTVDGEGAAPVRSRVGRPRW